VAQAFYISCLLLFMALPLLAYWRWGLAASLVVTVLELGLVVFVFPGMLDLLFPRPKSVEPPPQHPLEKIRRMQAEGLGRFVVEMMVPGMAVLIGGALSVVWSAAAAIWRSVASRRKERQ